MLTREDYKAVDSAERIRAELLRTPGAGVCPIGSCQVITLEGVHGERKHQLVVHGIVTGDEL
jgi:hypothetical protein